MNADLLIFDLDGTLIDSKRDLADSVNATRAWKRAPGARRCDGRFLCRQRRAGVDSPRVSRMRPEAELPGCSAIFWITIASTCWMRPRSIRACARRWTGYMRPDVAMAVLTNKPVRFSMRLLEGLGLEMHFFRVYGGNSFEEKKPHPRGIDLLVEESGADRSRTVMVGDSAVDVRTARNACVQACGVSWGFQPETFADAPPGFRDRRYARACYKVHRFSSVTGAPPPGLLPRARRICVSHGRTGIRYPQNSDERSRPIHSTRRIHRCRRIWCRRNGSDSRSAFHPGSIRGAFEHFLEQFHSAHAIRECRIFHWRSRIRHARIKPPEHLLVRIVVAFAVAAGKIGERRGARGPAATDLSGSTDSGGCDGRSTIRPAAPGSRRRRIWSRRFPD